MGASSVHVAYSELSCCSRLPRHCGFRSLSPVVEASMLTTENKALICRLFAIFNQRDSTPLSTLLAPTFVAHEPDTLIQGVAGVTMVRLAFPDVQYAIEGDII